MFSSINARLLNKHFFIWFGHCNATLLLNSGVDLKVVSEHLGHCDIGVTANIYADVLQKQKIRLADTIDDKLSEELT